MYKALIKTLVLGSIFVSGVYLNSVAAMNMTRKEWLDHPAVIEDHLRSGSYQMHRDPNYVRPSHVKTRQERQRDIRKDFDQKINKPAANRRKETPAEYRARKERNEKRAEEYSARREKRAEASRPIQKQNQKKATGTSGTNSKSYLFNIIQFEKKRSKPNQNII